MASNTDKSSKTGGSKLWDFLFDTPPGPDPDNEGEFLPRKHGLLSSLGRMSAGVGLGLNGQVVDFNSVDQDEFDQYLKRQQGDIPNPLSQAVNALMLDRLSQGRGEVNPSELSVTEIGPTPRYTPLQGSIAKKQFGLDPISEQEINAFGSGLKKDVETKSDVKKSQLTADSNLSLVTGNLRDLTQAYVDAHKEGAAGNLWKAKFGEMAAGGVFPEEIGDKFPAVAAYPGKQFEVVAKMFPMLTQQVGKEGSVRIIERIFGKLEKTLPALKNPKKGAKRMAETTTESLFRVSRALGQIDLSEYDLQSKEGEGAFVRRMKSVVNQIKITGKEKKLLEEMQKEATAPLTEYIKEKDASKGFKVGGYIVEVE